MPVVAIMLLAISLTAQVTDTRSKGVRSWISVEVCDLLLDPSRYRDELVRITGVFEQDIRPLKPCPKKMVSEGRVWPNAISVAEAAPEDPENRPSGGLTLEEFYRPLKGAISRGEIVSVRAEFYGRLRARAKYDRAAVGFGHLGSFPMELDVHWVRQLAVLGTRPFTTLVK